jgi:hypothetical protein
MAQKDTNGTQKPMKIFSIFTLKKSKKTVGSEAYSKPTQSLVKAIDTI